MVAEYIRCNETVGSNSLRALAWAKHTSSTAQPTTIGAQTSAVLKTPSNLDSATYRQILGHFPKFYDFLIFGLFVVVTCCPPCLLESDETLPRRHS
jgi:hypothetical protein